MARKTPLRKTNRGEGIVSTKPRPKNVYDFLGLVYCFAHFCYFFIIDECCVQETRWTGSGARVTGKGMSRYKFFCHGCKDGNAGVEYLGYLIQTGGLIGLLM